jgi:RNA polymerase sigma factor (sigma-70 family)
MSEGNDWLARGFEAHRGHLCRVAYRMLGSLGEAEDAVQEAWLRFAQTQAKEIDNLGAWLTTVVSRVCLDALRSRKARREEPLEDGPDDPPASIESSANPESEAELAESVAVALLVVLETLDPAERIALVLHDMFDLPFEEIAAIVGRSPAAARQLASRARRRVRGAPALRPSELKRQCAVVDAFVSALRAGDFEGLVAILDPDVVFRAEVPGRPAIKVHGAKNWAKGALAYARAARAMQPALVNGAVGLILAPRGRLLRALIFKFDNGRIQSAEIISDPARVRALDVGVLP